MRVVCAWCAMVLSDVNGPVSHGICDSCSATVERAFHRTLAQRRLDARRRSRANAERTQSLPLPGFYLAGPLSAAR